MRLLDHITLSKFLRILTNKRDRKTGKMVLARSLHSLVYSLIEDEGIDVMEQDWDNLIILDACRYDTFESRYNKFNIRGDIYKVNSKASSSMEFMKKNFSNKILHDTVYVTANPHVEHLEKDIFHRVIPLLDDDFWDSETDTVLPQTVVREAIRAKNEHPNKRLIVHFMQPHYPFLGETGEGVTHRGYNRSQQNPEHDVESIWAQLRYGNSSEDLCDVKRAYEENLDVVLAFVENLVDSITGRTVITADHGNFLGEKLKPTKVREYGHPEYVTSPYLIHVPWFVIDSDERPKIISEVPDDNIEHSDEVVSDRLRSLGYMD